VVGETRQIAAIGDEAREARIGNAFWLDIHEREIHVAPAPDRLEIEPILGVAADIEHLGALLGGEDGVEDLDEFREPFRTEARLRAPMLLADLAFGLAHAPTASLSPVIAARNTRPILNKQRRANAASKRFRPIVNRLESHSKLGDDP